VRDVSAQDRKAGQGIKGIWDIGFTHAPFLIAIKAEASICILTTIEIL